MRELIEEPRSPFYIGKGRYRVVYTHPISEKVANFIGVCENFNASGIRAFWNKSREQMLLVPYSSILGLYPLDSQPQEKD